MDTLKLCFQKNTFQKLLLRKFWYFLLSFAKSRKIPPFWFFSKRLLPIFYLAKETTQVVYFQKNLFRQLFNESSFVSCSDLHFCEKNSTHQFSLETNCPNHLFSRGDQTFCVLKKYFSTPFVTNGCGLFCTICRFAKTYHRLVFFKMNYSNHFFRSRRNKKLYFQKNIFRQL